MKIKAKRLPNVLKKSNKSLARCKRKECLKIDRKSAQRRSVSSPKLESCKFHFTSAGTSISSFQKNSLLTLENVHKNTIDMGLATGSLIEHGQSQKSWPRRKRKRWRRSKRDEQKISLLLKSPLIRRARTVGQNYVNERDREERFGRLP